jgi:hypothetical protein
MCCSQVFRTCNASITLDQLLSEMCGTHVLY